MRIFGWPSRCKAESITTYTREGKVDFPSLPGHDQPHVEPREVTRDQLAQTLRDMRLARGKALPVAPPVPKDASVSPRAFHMAYDGNDGASLDFIKQMALVGRVEGFHVYASGLSKNLPNVTGLDSPGHHDTWAEDHGELTERGELVIPAILPADAPIEEWVTEGRGRRYDEHHLRCDYGRLGTVNERRSQEEAVSAALASGIPKFKMAVSYVEGGNLLPGHRPDGTPFALVGKDSVAVTREVMGAATDDQAQAQIAADYGLKPEQLVSVEQPGEFHLDMAMALARPGQVLLNDSRAVAALQKGWLSEHYTHKWIKWGQESQLEKVEEHAARQAPYEDQVEKELKAAGFEVVRVPGSFPASAANRKMNFLNLRQGEHYAVALGGDERAEQAFAETLLKDGYERVHFLNRELTEETLHLNGGLKCRTKGRL